MSGAVVAVVVREFLRFSRQRGRLLSTFARPLLWLIVIGSGFGGALLCIPSEAPLGGGPDWPSQLPLGS